MTGPLEHLLNVLDTEGGGLVIVKKADWSVAVEFGQEAEDSPMVGGAAYGLGATLAEAVQSAATSCGWKSPTPKRLVCYDDTGREVVSWQVHVESINLLDAPREAQHAIGEAALVVAEDGEHHRVLKSRLTELDLTAERALQLLRAGHGSAPADVLVDDTRPRVDGTPCPWRGHSQPGLAEADEVCALQTGHEGAHDPIAIS